MSIPAILRSSICVLMGLCAAVLLAGCNASAQKRHDADFVFVYLKSGPKSGQGDKDTRQKMFAGHMANIRRLADEKKLVIAGPFAKPADKTWRGILIMDVTKTEEAKALAATDPGVQAGEFVADAHAMRASGSLRNLLAFEGELKRETGNEPVAPGQPPKNIRAYVMITCEDFQHTGAAVSRSTLRDAVVWSGQFSGTPRGVIVVDATDAEQVRTSLKDAGACAIDGWWSTVSLMRLRDKAPSLAEPTEQ